MNKPSRSLHSFLIGGVLFSVATATSTLLISTAQTNAVIDEKIQHALDTKLPGAIATATANIEAEKTALIVQANLAGWDAASPSTPDNRHIYGALNAEFSLVEYSDFECGYCRRFHDTPKGLADQAGGRINWEWQHFPLGFHNPVSSNASHASMCVSELAGNRAFWAFTGAWFKASGMGGKGVEDITALAASVGAPAKDFEACMDSERYKQAIEQQIEKGAAMGVTGTPGTFVVDNSTGNRVFVRGAQPASSLIQAIKQLQDMRQQPADTSATEE